MNIDKDKLNELYEKYQKENKRKEELDNKILEYYEENKDELKYLLDIRDVLLKQRNLNYDNVRHYNKLIDEFIERNSLLKEYLNMNNQKKCISDNIVDIEDEFSLALGEFSELFNRCVILTDKDKVELVELYTKMHLDITSLSQDNIDLIKKVLDKNNSFIGSISKRDLPLVNNLIIIHENYDLYDMDPYDREEEAYLIEEDISREIGRDIKEAYRYDSEELDDELLKNNLDNAIKKLEKNKDKMDEEKYYHQYFTLKIVKDRHIEELYLNTPDNLKGYFIDTLNDLMENGFITKLKSDKNNFPIGTYIKVLTASPIVNEEIAKRRESKVLKKTNI